MSITATPITVVGRVITDVTTRLTQTGDKVANFRIACQERHFDRTTETWVDGDRMYLTVVCWRALAEHAADSLRKGDQIVANGRLKLREYTTEKGERRTNLEVEARAIGPDLALHTVAVARPDWTVVPRQQELLGPQGLRQTSEPPPDDPPAPGEDVTRAA
ncbi:single-stranded DNA-binding protein [Actinophytocola oryzae]|uniref:Single-stranded DNA-binding protein n=1 Tax=Actinophytocola oryzae TaxID=502181 RepID=A0A4R7USL7_9PSEU|nr:single-stranded DNA-binding protein [Actinophytocola oryzae]TDV38754.1 single-strand DNA-binding protein [Actinophytocola oryzae]